MHVNRIYLLCFVFAFLSCEKENKENIQSSENIATGGFLSFTSTGQTLPTAINTSTKIVRFEIDRNVDVTRLIPQFDVPEGYSVQLNGIKQISGSSVVDFSKPVLYELKDAENRTAKWQAEAVPLKRKILIDASHDGGVWWFPQSPLTGFDQNKWHQGQVFAEHLRKKGFEVDELGRETELKEEKFFGYYIVIRACGFEPYTAKELAVYTKLIDRGMNMVFFTDHKKHDPSDELGKYIGLQFEGVASGKVSTFKNHMITENISSIDYIAGSVLTNPNKNLEVLGWLGKDDYADLNFNGIKDNGEPSAPPVMGILSFPKTRIFFIGDMNGLQVMPQPFIDNLINWMGTGY